MSGVAVQMPPEAFAEAWPSIQRELDKVPHIWEPWWTKEYLFHAVMCGQFQVWAAGHDGTPHMYLVTQIANYPAARVMQSILILGNSFDASVDALWAVLEQFARAESCTRVEVTGRRGFEKKLYQYGLRLQGVVVGCPVSQLRMQ